MTNKERSVKFIEVVMNDRNDDAISGFLHPDVSVNLEGGVVCHGLDEFRAWRQELYAAMPDMRIEVTDAIEEGPKVAMRWVASATIGGQSERAEGMTWHLHRGDKIVEAGDAWNKSAIDAKLEAAAAAAA